MLNRDAELKKARGYTDPKSFVRNDGSEVLHGQDWKLRKLELWERAKGRCEHLEPGVVFRRSAFRLLTENGRCTDPAHDPHHIKPRSKGRDDRLSNLQALCRFHHDLLDKRKIGGRT